MNSYASIHGVNHLQSGCQNLVNGIMERMMSSEKSTYRVAKQKRNKLLLVKLIKKFTYLSDFQNDKYRFSLSHPVQSRNIMFKFIFVYAGQVTKLFV